MPEKATSQTDWDAPLTVTARRGDVAAAAQQLGYANNPSAEALRFLRTLQSALSSSPEQGGEAETLATVRGHLEGYADVLASPGAYVGPETRNALVRLLREDAEKLKALSLHLKEGDAHA